jgi:hypothetical protein
LRATQHLYFDYDFLVLLVCPQAPPEICLLTRLATADSHLISKKKNNSLEFPSTYALKCLPFIHIFSSSSLLLLCVCVSLCPSIVTIRGYRKLDSFDQSVRARRIREIELYVSFSLSLLCLSVSVYLVGSIKRESKKRRKKREREKVFPDGRGGLLISTTYYYSSSPLRLDALGKCFVKLKKERSRERKEIRRSKKKN